MKLTAAQEAALNLNQNVVVEACAGSGKTTMLVSRYLQILRDQPDLAVENILAFTYTRKAASEMLHRIRKSLMPRAADNDDTLVYKRRLLVTLGRAQITTIHGFCLRLLEQHSLEAGFGPTLKVLDEDQTNFIRRNAYISGLQQLKSANSNALKSLLLEWPEPTVLAMIHSLALSGETTGDWIQKHRRAGSASAFLGTALSKEDTALSDAAYRLLLALCEVYEACKSVYSHEKKLIRSFDYDDLIQETVRLLETNPAIRALHQNTIHHILVDEFQDSNPLQWRLISLLSDDRDPFTSRKLFLVGDRFQSIYGFRNASPKLFEDILKLKDRPEIQHIIANDNFRSSPQILEFINGISQHLFRESPLPFPPLQARKTTPDRGNIAFAWFEEKDVPTAESQFAAEWIRDQLKDGRSPGDFAILFRKKNELENYRRALETLGIPARVHGGKGLFEQPEVLDIYNLAKALSTPEDLLSWIGVLKSPLFGLTENGLYWLTLQHPELPIPEKLSHCTSKAFSELATADATLIVAAAERIPDWLTRSRYQPLPWLIDDILLETGTWAIYSAQSPQATHNITTLLEKMKQWHHAAFTEWQDLSAMLDHHFENSDLAAAGTVADAQQDAVNLMTIHAAKGLEFPVVLLPELSLDFYFGASNPLLVSQEAGFGLSYQISDQKNLVREHVYNTVKAATIEEEKRIFYVACTRAKESLLLMARDKARAGNRVSAWLSELGVRDRDQSVIRFVFPGGTATYPLLKTTIDAQQKRTFQKSTQNEHALPPLKPFPKSIKSGIIQVTVSDLLALSRCARQYQLRDRIAAYDRIATKGRRQTAAVEGLVLHRLIAQTGLKITMEKVVALVQEMGLPQAHAVAADVLSQYDSLVNSPFFRTLQEQPMQTELPFQLKLGNAIVSGRMDALITTSDAWRIVDFKTNNVAPSAAEMAGEKYRTQLLTYLLAGRFLRGRQKRYTASIYFTRIQTEIPFHFSDAELTTFEMQLTQLCDLCKPSSFSPPTHSVCEACSIYKYDPDCPNRSTFKGHR